MYSGQLENVQLPIATFGCVSSGIGVAAFCARSSVPSIPQPVSELASASEPARPMKRRRVVRLSHGPPRTCAPAPR